MRNKSANILKKLTLIHFGMMACCAVMLLPVGAFFLAGGSLTGLGSNLSFFAPILLCLGAHLILHRFIGRMCHAAASKAEVDQTQAQPQKTETLASHR